ncbi:MAG TPA: hypothetical protein VK530_02200 [Candidatus Acidoferrum sp.]|nr:hypothetical protein [Candidatus Acidoferrum sp.]
MNRRDCSTSAVIFAALTIIGCCVSSMFNCRKRRVEQREQLEVAEQNWEAEGGAVRPDPEEQFA